MVSTGISILPGVKLLLGVYSVVPGVLHLQYVSVVKFGF